MDLKNTILRNLGVSYIKRTLKVIRGPVFASLFITRECNYKCKYCSVSKGEKKHEITLKQWKTIVLNLYNQGCRFITIYGGEPTLRSDLGELIKYCIKLKIFTHVVTNGTLLTEDLLEEFASYGYLLLGVGIDSLSECNFSPKIFRPELIDLLHKVKKKYPNSIDYSIHIVTCKENIHKLIPLIKSINQRLECRFSIDPVHSSLQPQEEYKYRDYCPDLLLTKKSMNSLRKVVLNLKRLGVNVWSPNHYYHYMNKWYQGKLHWKCDAGNLYYAIDSDGTVMLCEDVQTDIHFNEFLKLTKRKRVKVLRKSMYKYCTCFKPCYWNPTVFVRHPIKNLLSYYRFK